MNILIVTETYPPNINGAAFATQHLAQELAKRGHQIAVIAPSTALKYYKTKRRNVTVYRLPSIIIQRNLKFRVSPQLFHIRKFRAIVETVKPEIMHINNPGFLAQTAITLAKQRKVPIIGTSHFMPENITHYLHLPDQFEKLLNSNIWKIYARFYGRLDIIISPTQTAADLLTKLSVNTRIVVISNGIDLKKFNPNNNGAYLIKKYKIPNKPVMLYVGRLDKEKCIDVLLKAIALIKDKVDFHTIIVGKGQEEKNLKKLASNLDISSLITFTGYLPQKDLPNIYTIADIFVIPSIAELQSLVTMEAMACGLPVVGSSAVALPHLIKDGKNGFLFTPKDEHDLSNKLLMLLKSHTLREKMSKRSLKIIKDHDMSKVIIKMENLYKRVITKN